MSKLRRGGRLLLFLALAGVGCSKADSERLGRLAHVIAGKATALGQATNTRLHNGWQNFRTSIELNALDARVSTRLRWDKQLAATPIRVEAQGSRVFLKGAVASLDLRRRAVDLAQSTVGVTEVIDQLQSPGTE